MELAHLKGTEMTVVMIEAREIRQGDRLLLWGELRKVSRVAHQIAMVSLRFDEGQPLEFADSQMVARVS